MKIILINSEQTVSRSFQREFLIDIGESRVKSSTYKLPKVKNIDVAKIGTFLKYMLIDQRISFKNISKYLFRKNEEKLTILQLQKILQKSFS